MQHYWQNQAARRPNETAVVHFGAEAARQVQDVKYQYSWACEEAAPEGGVHMTLRLGCLRQLAGWLLPVAGQATVVSPPALQDELRALAQAAHRHFGAAE